MSGSRKTRTIGLFAAGLLVAAAPALADAIAGCAIPLIPRPDALQERAWSPSELTAALGRLAEMNFRTEAGEAIPVLPHYGVLVRDRGSRPVASGDGSVTKLEPGRQPLGDALGSSTLRDAGTALGRTIERLRYGSARLQVTETRVLEHDERVRWPRDDARVAVWFDVSDAETREEPTRSHKLVVFLAPSRGGEALSSGRAAPASDEGSGSAWAWALLALVALPVLRHRRRRA